MTATTETRTRTGWTLVAEALRAEGVPILFGLPGDPRHLFDDLAILEPEGGPKIVGVRYETSGAFMAMAYTRVSGQLAACFGCPGPGVANLVPGVLEAYSGCTPMLVLAVRASRQTDGMGAFQETDHLGLMRPITKWATCVEVPEKIAWTIRRAIQIATTGKPGPVYVELPADVGFSEIGDIEYAPATTDLRPGPDPEALLQAADLIAGSQRPLLITGGGTILSGAGDAVARFSREFGIPVQTTPAGRGSVPESEELFCGLVGLYRTSVPKAIYEAADLYITVGARMEEFQGGFLPRNPDAKVIQIDIDPFEISRNWRADVAIQADARLAIDALHGVLLDGGFTRNDALSEEIASRRHGAIASADAETDASIASAGMPMKGSAIIREANRVFGNNTILCNENGGQDLWSYFWPFYEVLDPGCCVPPAEQTAMGYGVIGAMAAKIAAPDRNVLCTTGDGAFTMSCHELGTAVQEGLGVTWLVLNDSAFGWVQWIQRRTCGDRLTATQFEPGIDILATAAAAGCEGIKVNHPSELSAALERALSANKNGRPFVVEVPVDQAHHHAEFDRFHDFEPLPDSSTV